MESKEGMNDEFILTMGLTKRKNHMRILEQKRDHRNTMKINAKYNPTRTCFLDVTARKAPNKIPAANTIFGLAEVTHFACSRT